MSYLEQVYERYRLIAGNAMDVAVFAATIFSDFVLLERIIVGTDRTLTRADVSYWNWLRGYIGSLPKERSAREQEELRIAYFLEYVRTGKRNAAFERQFAPKAQGKQRLPRKSRSLPRTRKPAPPRQPGPSIPPSMLQPNSAAPLGYRIVVIDGRQYLEPVKPKTIEDYMP